MSSPRRMLPATRADSVCRPCVPHSRTVLLSGPSPPRTPHTNPSWAEQHAATPCLAWCAWYTFLKCCNEWLTFRQVSGNEPDLRWWTGGGPEVNDAFSFRQHAELRAMHLSWPKKRAQGALLILSCTRMGGRDATIPAHPVATITDHVCTQPVRPGGSPCCTEPRSPIPPNTTAYN